MGAPPCGGAAAICSILSTTSGSADTWEVRPSARAATGGNVSVRNCPAVCNAALGGRSARGVRHNGHPHFVSERLVYTQIESTSRRSDGRKGAVPLRTFGGGARQPQQHGLLLGRHFRCLGSVLAKEVSVGAERRARRAMCAGHWALWYWVRRPQLRPSSACRGCVMKFMSFTKEERRKMPCLCNTVDSN